MKWLLIYVVSLFLLWQAIDIEANTLFASALAPIAFVLVLVGFLMWLSVKLGGRATSGSRDVGGVSTGGYAGGGDSCGGDGGGC